MKCENCGRQVQNEEANFCEYCGSSFREQRQGSYNMPPRSQVLPNLNGPMYNTPPMQGPGMQGSGMPGPGMPGPVMSGPGMPGPGMPGAPFTPQPMERPASFLSWLGTYALLFIPIFGWLAFIILLCIWSFSDSTPTTKKNWARATLIFAGILIVAFVAYMIFIMSTPMYQQMYQQMMDSYTNGVQ